MYFPMQLYYLHMYDFNVSNLNIYKNNMNSLKFIDLIEYDYQGICDQIGWEGASTIPPLISSLFFFLFVLKYGKIVVYQPTSCVPNIYSSLISNTYTPYCRSNNGAALGQSQWDGREHYKACPINKFMRRDEECHETRAKGHHRDPPLAR
jgi:hypothetical protein